ncbi:D-alanyl-D-alanine carboxypeptidase [Cryobacterium sinapicolor]|uniref:D-alanyl-D-alanine carboxypeptidase n=1 Tax=Cryobacterium sinapicolor TaxID=1259236 RepID=A0ABY2J7F6_9MICO|nr:MULTISPECIES: D-alanyl-D-alanine carboxypeptidase [Cryobacterium]TFC88875.1 D-alanyl-D-alanine carboxypeptidase [Cryobacterium sp. TMT3-29-2]TFC99993.1 D-alanyl-D-alanine carboxypeptidase [Cryobacterium sinapicolor]
MPLTRRQTFLRRRIAVVAALALTLGGVGYLAGTGLAPVPAAAVELIEPATLTQPAAELVWPDDGAGSIGAVGYPGLLGSTGDQGSMPIASITKMVTALVLLEEKPLNGKEPGPDIRFTDDDVDIYYDVLAEDGSVAPVSAGMVLSQREAFEAMLLPSANNYSISLAIWAFGSVDAYLAEAEAWLTDNGLTDTTVADTSGLSPASVSSPADLVRLGKLVLADPVLAEIVSMETSDLPIIGTVSNTNKLLGSNGVTGMKTGTTDEAGACLLYSAEFSVGGETITVVGVMLGGDTHSALNASIVDLLDSVEPGFREVNLADKGTAYASYGTQWGQTSRAVAAEGASAVVWSDTPITAVPSARPVTLGKVGDSAGAIDFQVGESTVSVPLVLDGELTDPGPAWRFTHPGELAAG